LSRIPIPIQIQIEEGLRVAKKYEKLLESTLWHHVTSLFLGQTTSIGQDFAVNRQPTLQVKPFPFHHCHAHRRHQFLRVDVLYMV